MGDGLSEREDRGKGGREAERRGSECQSEEGRKGRMGGGREGDGIE